ncbi:hypothetical protein PR202_gb07686 [Eleusine coracana subsp. coracana]|uniref:Uncharacterized protein n=1 Tax=Eleusine coracana subsp. coracana TaxID=191504 RepID=A0AAV5ECR9_ELECO|nr:hypothetical protein PR202_gb07686 [Eleusine coracana subsp. coracana]
MELQLSFGLTDGSMDSLLWILLPVYLLPYQEERFAVIQCVMHSLIVHGSMIYKEHSQLVSYWNIYKCGISFMSLSCNLMWKILTFGDWQVVGNTQPNLPIRAYSWEQFSLNHGREFGDLGRRLNAVFSYGLLLINAAGRLIV